jgi:CRP-like cAMP-binding protein
MFMLLANTFQKLPLFKDIQLHILTAISQASKLNYCKKSIVFYDALDAEKSYFYYIIKGWVKLFTVSLEGIEIVRDILTDNQHFNEKFLCQDHTEALSAQALSDIQIIMIPLSVLKQALAQDSQLTLNFLNASLQKQCELSHAIEHLSIQNAAQRIGCLLLRLCPNNRTRSITLHFPYGKALAATRLGMCPETFSRALLSLSKVCHLKVKGEIIYIPQVDTLSQYVCKQCSLSYPCQANINPLTFC